METKQNNLKKLTPAASYNNRKADKLFRDMAKEYGCTIDEAIYFYYM